MGVIKRGILGGFSGKVANVVGSSWKGIATLKSLPLSVANPNTAAQVAQRTKMRNIVAFAKEILTDIIKPLNDRFASGQSGFNLFVQRNIALFALQNPVAASALILSSGNVTGAENLTATRNPASAQVDTAYDDNTGVGNALATDLAFIVVYNVTQNNFGVSSGLLDRSIGAGAFVVMPTVVGGADVLNCWMSFRRADGTQVSDTAYDLVV